jgi:superoxide reductase
MTERLAEKIKTADWKTEKHVPVIECKEKPQKDEPLNVKISVGKEIAHPNTTEHHIRFIRAFFVPDGGTAAYDLGYFEFNAHGESGAGPNKGPVYTHPEVGFAFKTNQSGTINAISYCNIHGLWESSKKIEVI